MSESDPNWALKGLGASEPFAENKDKLAMFGQFVGDWIGEATILREDGTEASGGSGEVHFNWILDGRAVQDVWMVKDRSSGRMVPAGTTIRFYDPKNDNWQSTWISPLQNNTQLFIGRLVNDEIVLETINRRGQLEHWIFYEFSSGSSFKWRAEVSDDHGKTWKTNARYHFDRAMSA